jgi:hypothetical protein
MRTRLQNPNMLMNTLTYAGALPFIGLMVFEMLSLIFNTELQLITMAFITYSVVILSFMGGMHWGIGMTTKGSIAIYLFISSNVTALLAWTCLLLNSNIIALFFLLILFIYQYLIDWHLSKIDVFPVKFISTRKRITCIVAICLCLMILFQFAR